MRVECFDDDRLFLRSLSGATNLEYTLDRSNLRLRLKAPSENGPRSGIELDINLLDLPGETWKQCMPTTIYTHPDCSYAYFVFSTADDRCMGLAILGDFAAWRIKYSGTGHRMQGFQVLSRADDVVTGAHGPLKIVDTLDIGFAFGSRAECMDQICEMLHICAAAFDVSGGLQGASIPLRFAGRERLKRTVCAAPDGTVKDLAADAAGSVVLEQAGFYSVTTESDTGREHTGRILCHDGWEGVYDKVNLFYRTYFQHPIGAFYRAVWKESLSPEGGKTLEGAHFGDPYMLVSCHPGEFGGYAAQAMMKNCLMFGKKDPLMASINLYIDWALNRGREGETPYIGTVSHAPACYRGRQYEAYHLWRHDCLQDHVFLLEQLSDYYHLTADESILDEMTKLCLHFVRVYIDEDGWVGGYTDYSTVAVPMSALVRVGLDVPDGEARAVIMGAAERLADHICRRGLDFPTEGEACTEDGSMSCSVVSLLYAYKYVSPNPAYLDMAKTILAHHRVLEMVSADCRMNGSSLRFWETQYETRDWGPSINAGHGWTIWTAEAKALMADETGDMDLLCESYNGFVSNLSKVDANGGMPCCYTPDMIPGTPHGAFILHNDRIVGGCDEYPDLRKTSIPLAMDYVRETYSASGNHFLVKAGDIWSGISGISFQKNVVVNGVLHGDRFTGAAPQFDRLILDSPPPAPLTVECMPGNPVTVSVFDAAADIIVEGGTTERDARGFYVVMPAAGHIVIHR
jgi:hypothetical protein